MEPTADPDTPVSADPAFDDALAIVDRVKREVLSHVGE